MCRVIQKFLAFLFWLLARFWYRLEVSGAEHLNGLHGPLIVAANHKSYIDAFVIFAAIPRWWKSPVLPVRAMAYDQLFQNPFSKILMYALGAYPTYRGQGLDRSLKKPSEILREGGVVGIYPEGKRIRDKDIGSFRRGIGGLARKNPGVPILPIAIFGTKDVLFRVLPRLFRRVRVHFGAPFVPDPSRPGETIVAELRERIKKLYDAICEPVLQERLGAVQHR